MSAAPEDTSSPDLDAEAYRAIAENAVDAIFLMDLNGCTTYANPAAQAMFGWSLEELRGRTLHDVVHHHHPDGRPFPMADCPLGNVFVSGHSLRMHEDVFFHKDGSLVHVACSNAAISRAGSGVTGAVLIARDIGERHAAEQQRQLLLNELNHRVKNTLAVVQAIARQSLQGDDLAAARHAFEGRLMALASTQDLITNDHWQAAQLQDVVEVALEPFISNAVRVEAGGPAVFLPSKAAMMLSLALHELATNATKYGALSVPDGKVAIHWTRQRQGERSLLTFHWVERDGPPVAPPSRRGFGTVMIERALASELDGEAHLSYEPNGLVFQLTALLD